jgi:hypothetical protein
VGLGENGQLYFSGQAKSRFPQFRVLQKIKALKLPQMGVSIRAGYANRWLAGQFEI